MRRLRAGLLAVGLAAAALLGLDRWIDATVLLPLAPAVSAEVHDRHGRLLRAWPVEDGRWRLATARSDVDRAYLDRLVAYEDRRFFSHPGVDPLALLRAGGQALRHGRIVSGGSTLTMQVARLLEGTGTGSLAAKLRQMRVALALERRLDKGAILDLYLTLAPFGGNVEGVRAASWVWFGREPKGLTPAEIALLVALPQAPESRRPDRFAAEARAARDRVLGRAGFDPADAAAFRPAPVPAQRRPLPTLAAHAAEAHRAEAGAVRLTLDAGLQGRLEALLKARVAAHPAPVAAAAMVVDHATGAVLASAGAADLLDAGRHGAVDMTQAVRSPGSALKPLIYGLGFEAGLIHPETLVADRPTRFGGWAPENFDRGFQGEVSVRVALQASLNVPAVAVLEAVGPPVLAARMRRAGAPLRLPGGQAPGLAVALGGGGVTLADLVTLYAAMARGGEAVALRWRAEAPEGGEAPRLLSARAAWQVAEVLAGAAPPPGAAMAGGARTAVAWKTGTSYGYRDAWAVGFDGRHTVGVWLGRADGGAVPGLTGIDAAAPLMFALFGLLPEAPLPPRPATLPALAHADLPPGLRRFGAAAAPAGPEIAMPPDGARVERSTVPGAAPVIALRLREGVAPFTWMLDGRPLPLDPFARSATWPLPEPGFVTITVIDATGAAASSTVFVH